MSEQQEKLERIMDCINDETLGIDVNDRAMILLLLKEFITCAIELDILDTLKPKKKRTCEMRADGAHCMNGVEFYECCSCGEYACIPTVMGKSEPPRYCPNCGAKVVSE